ncbi:hypothetical protein WH50_23025 [Pokkaliibacter plantistimulans]|uniref:Uncharacterized protein n=1 Tax=Pokkaliibacter plantistimulans TaxID=1635171 RepID=A0ABX5LTW8_9GAMM|nr:hypothetical protein WH50_23025 [Pokkaliibacter plantistimulans]
MLTYFLFIIGLFLLYASSRLYFSEPLGQSKKLLPLLVAVFIPSISGAAIILNNFSLREINTNLQDYNALLIALLNISIISIIHIAIQKRNHSSTKKIQSREDSQ